MTFLTFRKISFPNDAPVLNVSESQIKYTIIFLKLWQNKNGPNGMHLRQKRIKKRCIPTNVWPFLFQQSFKADLWAKIYFIWLFTCTRMVILSHTCTIEWGVTYSFLYEHFPLNRSYRIWVGLSSIQSCTANLSRIFLQKYLQLKFRKSWNQIIVSSIVSKNEWKKLSLRFSS